MITPRCGDPDIVNGTNYMQPRKSKKRGNPRWPATKTRLTYRFSPGFPPNYVDPVARAFQQWQSATRFSFSHAANGQTSDLVIAFHRRDHGDGAPFDGPGGTLAHAFSPTDGRFHYDADDAWSVGQDPNAFHVETLAVHEIGHLLGLGHSDVEAAIMFPTFRAGEVKTLNQDDINGIAALYGA